MLDAQLLAATAGQKFLGPNGGILAPDRAQEAIAFYDEVRRIEPVLYLGDDTWLVTRYEDARVILRDTRFSSRESAVFRDDADDLQGGGFTNSMLFLDPPDHTRLRGLVQQAFVPRRIQRMEADIELPPVKAVKTVQPPGNIVPLQKDNLFAKMCEPDSRSQAGHPGTDDHDVKMPAFQTGHPGYAFASNLGNK